MGQFLSKKRTAQALAELFGTPLSEGTVARMVARAADGLDGFCDEARKKLTDAKGAGSITGSQGHARTAGVTTIVDV